MVEFVASGPYRARFQGRSASPRAHFDSGLDVTLRAYYPHVLPTRLFATQRTMPISAQLRRFFRVSGELSVGRDGQLMGTSPKLWIGTRGSFDPWSCRRLDRW